MNLQSLETMHNDIHFGFNAVNRREAKLNVW